MSPGKAPVTQRSVWERLPLRADQPSLSRSQIVRTAIAIADVEGAQGITMRRIATALGAGAMSLYRHVFSKDDLLDLMLDDVFGEIALPNPASGTWRSNLAVLAHETRVVFKRHPWLSALLNSRPTLGPNYMRLVERSLAVLVDLNLDSAVMVQMVGMLYAYVGGVVSAELAAVETARQTGLSVDDRLVQATPYIEQLIATGEYPHFARFYRAGIRLDAEHSFDLGVQCLLDGFAARIAHHQTKTSGADHPIS